MFPCGYVQECSELTQRLSVETRLKSSHADEVSVLQRELERERENRARELADLTTKHLQEKQQMNTQHAQKVRSSSLLRFAIHRSSLKI